MHISATARHIDHGETCVALSERPASFKAEVTIKAAVSAV